MGYGADAERLRAPAHRQATLQLWTKTVNGVTGQDLRLSLHPRTVLGLPTDIPLPPPADHDSRPTPNATWPTRLGGNPVDYPFVSLPTLLPNERLGVAIQVERANTGNDGLEFMYDHPSFESRLQIEADRGAALLVRAVAPTGRLRTMRVQG